MEGDKKQKKSIGIWLPNFDTFEMNKCYGQIALGLFELGADVALLTSGKGEIHSFNNSDDYDATKLRVIGSIENSEAKNIFSEFDYVIMYTWFAKNLTNWVKEAKESGCKVILKLDHNGKFGTRETLVHSSQKYIIRNFWRIEYILKVPRLVLKNLLVFSSTKFKRNFFKHLIVQAELADRIIIESPHAAYNLVTIFGDLGVHDLIEKIRVIPNPVSPSFSRSAISNVYKENLVVAVGRWNDEAPKNPKDLVRTIVEFLSKKNNWKVVIIGPGEDILQNYIKKYSPDKFVASKIQVVGRLKNEDIIRYLVKSKIILSSSRWESFGIAAAEALCLGNTLVGPRIESFEYLSNLGFSGTLALSHNWKDLLATLIYESELWKKGQRNPEEIANFWREILDRKMIAQKFLDILE